MSHRTTRSPRARHQVAQGVEAAGLVGGADLDHQVAVTEGRLEPIVGKGWHPRELDRLLVGEAEPPVEQRGPEADRDGQVRRPDAGAQDAALGWRVERVAGSGRPAAGQLSERAASTRRAPSSARPCSARRRRARRRWLRSAAASGGRCRPDARRRTGCSPGRRRSATCSPSRPPRATPPTPPATAATPTAADPVRNERRESRGGVGGIGRRRYAASPRRPVNSARSSDRSASRAWRSFRSSALTWSNGLKRRRSSRTWR